MSMSSRPSLHLNSPQTSSSDSIKFPDFFLSFLFFLSLLWLSQRAGLRPPETEAGSISKEFVWGHVSPCMTAFSLHSLLRRVVSTHQLTLQGKF